MLLSALPLLVNWPLHASATALDPRAFAADYALGQVPPMQAMPPPPKRLGWRKGQMIMQGFFGVTNYDTVEHSDGIIQVDGSGEDAAELPVFGGGAQWKLGGERIDFGLEAMFSFAWRANATAIAVGGGGLAVAVDVDTFTTELYGGPFANIFMGDAARVYASAGPLLQWLSYDQESPNSSPFDYDDSGSGFGTGYYARTGIEFMLSSRSMIGLGVRWSDSSVDLGGDGDLDLEGIQWAFTVSHGF